MSDTKASWTDHWLEIVIAVVVVLFVLGLMVEGFYNEHFRCPDGYQWTGEKAGCVSDSQIQEDFGG